MRMFWKVGIVKQITIVTVTQRAHRFVGLRGPRLWSHADLNSGPRLVHVSRPGMKWGRVTGVCADVRAKGCV